MAEVSNALGCLKLILNLIRLVEFSAQIWSNWTRRETILRDSRQHLTARLLLVKRNSLTLSIAKMSLKPVRMNLIVSLSWKSPRESILTVSYLQKKSRSSSSSEKNSTSSSKQRSSLKERSMSQLPRCSTSWRKSRTLSFARSCQLVRRCSNERGWKADQ